MHIRSIPDTTTVRIPFASAILVVLMPAIFLWMRTKAPLPAAGLRTLRLA